MKIGLVIERLYGGGAERVVSTLAEGLAGRRHRVFVYCLRDGGPAADKLRERGVTVREFDSRGRDPLLAARLAWHLLRDRVQVVNAHSSAALVWSLPAARLLGVPVVQTRHGALLGRPSRYRRLADRLSPLVTQMALVAESLRGQLPRGRHRATARCVPNGFDQGRVAAADARAELARHCGRALDGPVVLSVGTVCPEKDTVGMLAAFRGIRERWPQATLVLVGPQRDGQYATAVEDARRRLPEPDRVCLMGAVPDAWRLMAGADVFCLSSRTEALPNVLVEAMSQGVPIVATAVGDVGTIAADRPAAALLRHNETALLVPPGDPARLGAAIDEVLRDRDAAMQRAARASADYARQYTADAMVSRYQALFEDTLGRRPRNRQCSSPRPRVLLVGPAATQIGGMTSVIDGLQEGPLTQYANLSRYAPPSHGRYESWPIVGRCFAAARHIGGLLRLARRIVQQQIDIVHIHTCSFFSYYRSLCDVLVVRLLGRRAVLHIHGARFDEFCANAGRLSGLLRWGAEAADAVVVLSEAWRGKLQRYLGAARLVVIPNGVPLPAASTPQRQNPKKTRFLFLGAFQRRKGVAELLAATARLKDAGVAFELVMAGPPADGEDDAWPRVASDLGVADWVRFVGPVRGAEKDALLASADCLVLPSYHEGLPMVVLEAAATGCAIIATPIGGIPEFMTPSTECPAAPGCDHVAPLVPAGDVAALADAMQQMARDPLRRTAIGASLRRRVEQKYSDRVVADQTRMLYRRVLGQQPRVGGDLASWLVRNVTYPLHERLRQRPTLREYRRLQLVSAGAPTDVVTDVTRRLRNLLRFAQQELPFYARRFAAHGVDWRSERPCDELQKLPPLTKAEIRANESEMQNRDVPGGAIPHSSGGTTGDTLRFLIDRVRQSEDLSARLFMQGLFGVRPGDRRLHLWGSPIEQRGLPLKRWRDRLLNEVLLDAFEMSPVQMDRHLERIRRFQPRVIYGYPTALARLAEHAQRRHRPRDFAWLQLIVLTGEEVTDNQRTLVQQAFGCAVAAEYGSREVGLIAHECPLGSMHIVWPHLHVEIATADRNAATGDVGDVLCTTLNTRAQPLIRYRVGDVACLTGQVCACGLPWPVMRLVGGKITGFVALANGRLCHGAITSHVLRDQGGIVEFKTIQHALDKFEVLLVVNESFDHATLERVRARYRALFGEHVQVACRLVDRIPPDPSGKRRYVVSHVAPDYGELEIVSRP